MRERRLTTVEERQVEARLIAPEGFQYPERFQRVLAQDPLPEIDPFMWTSEYENQTTDWVDIVGKQYPTRSLVPFAKHQDTDDVFCFDGGDHSGNPPVLIIHTFASPGTEYRGQWTSFDVWWEEMEEHRAAWSHALRHEPGAYGLELDADGSVPLVDLVDALQRAGVAASEDDVHRVVVESDKQRFAVEGDRIRTQYGHSTEERIVKPSIVPQPALWHATSPAAAEATLRDGLLPMGRQYAHLTTDRELAMQAGRRKSTAPVLLRIDAARAHREGVEFSEGHDRVTLALLVPARYISAE